MKKKMKSFLFEYNEVARGVIKVRAFNENEAKEKAINLDGDIYIHNSEEEIGKLIEVVE